MRYHISFPVNLLINRPNQFGSVCKSSAESDADQMITQREICKPLMMRLKNFLHWFHWHQTILLLHYILFLPHRVMCLTNLHSLSSDCFRQGSFQPVWPYPRVVSWVWCYHNDIAARLDKEIYALSSGCCRLVLNQHKTIVLLWDVLLLLNLERCESTFIYNV